MEYGDGVGREPHPHGKKTDDPTIATLWNRCQGGGQGKKPDTKDRMGMHPT